MDVVSEVGAEGSVTMADCDNVLVRSACLEQEWRKMAVQLGDLCDGNRYVEYNKEIARLKLKLIHLQEELDGYKSQNDNLSSLNNSLLDKVKNLISVQDDQLEQYSTALVLLTEERRELWNCLGVSQKKLKNLEEKLMNCKCLVTNRTGITTEDVGINTDVVESGIESSANTGQSVASSLNRNIDEEVIPSSNITFTSRLLDGCESSFSSSSVASSVKNTPLSCHVKTGSFVNSMVEKLEKKRQLKSFDEPCSKRIDTTEPEHFDIDANNSLIAEYQARIESLQIEIDQMKETCQSLTGLLERTYEEMQPTSTPSRYDTKDQLIACLRSRLLEAICDLVKVEKQNPKMNVKSIACGSNYPNGESTLDLKRKASSSDSAPSPSKSKASKILSSPASKLKALSEENYNKLKKLSCWKPRTQ